MNPKSNFVCGDINRLRRRPPSLPPPPSQLITTLKFLGSAAIVLIATLATAAIIP